MKRIATSLLLLVMVVSLLSVSAFAASSISANSVTAKPGESVEITVSIAENPGLTSCDVAATYDDSALTLDDITLGDALTGGNPNKSTGKISFFSTSGTAAGAATLATYKFTVKEGAKGTVTVSFTAENACNLEYDDIEAMSTTATITVEVPPTTCTHENTEIQNAKEATCTEAGYTGDKVCKDCGETVEKGKEIKALGHKWGEWTVTKEATTTEKGERQRVCENDPTHVEKEEIPVVTCDHEWGEGVVTTEPTCTEAGVKTFTCSKCGDTKTETIPAKDHAWGEWVVTKEATCAAEGEETRTCKNDASHTETRTTAKLAHDFELKNAKEATCTEAGYTGDKVCKVCGETEKGKEIKALGHDWDKTTVKVPATETEDGVGTHTCKRCGATEDVTIPKTGTTKPTTTNKPAGKNDNPKTGDEMNVAVYAGILVLCGAATVAVVSKKKNHG